MPINRPIGLLEKPSTPLADEIHIYTYTRPPATGTVLNLIAVFRTSAAIYSLLEKAFRSVPAEVRAFGRPELGRPRATTCRRGCRAADIARPDYTC